MTGLHNASLHLHRPVISTRVDRRLNRSRKTTRGLNPLETETQKSAPGTAPTRPPATRRAGGGDGRKSAAKVAKRPPSGGRRRKPWGPFQVIGWFSRIVAAPLAIPLDLAVLGLFGVAVVLSVMVEDLPDVDALLEVKFEEPLRIYTEQGSLMAEFGVQRRRAVEFEEIPPDLINAFITAEDNRFFEHIGFDLIGLIRAAYAVVQSGSASQGGSTITMQVVRNFYLTPEKTVKRKISEILLALRVENALTKEEIMEQMSHVRDWGCKFLLLIPNIEVIA